MGKVKIDYEKITDKCDCNYGKTIFVSIDGRNFKQHVVRRKYSFENESEYSSYLFWLKYNFAKGYLFKQKQ